MNKYKFEILNRDNLPMDNKNKIIWKDIHVGFILKTKHEKYGYNDFEFIGYKKGMLVLQYNLKKYEIKTTHFTNGNIGRLVGLYGSDFKVKINQVIKDDKRDLIIIDTTHKKENNGQKQKYCNYHCNKCGNEGWIRERHLLSGGGCNACSKHRKIAVTGINTIYDITPWMMDLGVNIEDAKKYTPNSHSKIIVKCPYCGKEKITTPNKIYINKSIKCGFCNDNTSYPEKIIKIILNKLNVKYKVQYSPDWIKPKRYDFYLPDYNIIIETHGRQHYDENSFGVLKETIINDKYKMDMALENNIIDYIIIDCRISDIDWIKENILKSKLNKIFDLSKINWDEIEVQAIYNNVFKEVVDYWNNNITNVKELHDIFNLGKTTIYRYLKKGNELGLCIYNNKNN